MYGFGETELLNLVARVARGFIQFAPYILQGGQTYLLAYKIFQPDFPA